MMESDAGMSEGAEMTGPESFPHGSVDDSVLLPYSLVTSFR